MPSRKEKVGKQVWRRVHGFLDVSGEDMAEYMAAKRKVEKLADDPEFIVEADRHFKNFADFLRNYNLNIQDFNRFLNMDMSDFMKKKR